jgi:hypothetical protein
VHIRYLQSSFTAGELSPKMMGQVDFAQYQFGCEWLSNFLVWPQGMATRRPGTRYIAAGKEPDTPIRIIPFEYSTEQAYIIEAGEGYFRFYMDQGQILDGVVPYEIEHDYDAYDLFDIYYCQSADIMYLAHSDYPPRMLSRTGHTDWTLEEIEFINGPYLAQNTDATKTLGLASVTVPTVITITDVTDNGAGLIKITAGTHGFLTADDVVIEGVVGVPGANGGWEVTVIDADNFTLNDSVFDGTYVSGGTAKKLTVATWAGMTIDEDHLGSYWGHYNTTWGYFKIWRVLTDSTASVEMKVTNSGGAATEDWREGAWSTYRGFPSVVGFYENRLIWAATNHQPQTLWGSKTGDYYNHTPGAEDDDPIAVTLNSDYVNAIKWISGQKVLLVGTSRGQWHVSATGTNEAMTPSNIKAVQETGLTSSGVMSRCDHTVLFWQQFGRNLMEIAYSLESDSYVATPLTIMAEHMFRGDSATEMAYLQEPLGSLWCTKYYGELAVLTYERQHKVVAWSRLVTDGDFESVARIPGEDRDEIWVVVRRHIGGVQVRYIELFEDLETYDQDTEYMFYVDSGLTYLGAATTTISGLDHLIGETVAVLADGAVHEDCVVDESGEITLTRAAIQVHAGLPYYSIMKPVRAEVKLQGGTIQNRRQRLVTLGMRLYKTYGGYISEDLDSADIIPFRTMGETMDVPLEMFTGDKRVQFPGSYNRNGQYYILQLLPLPFNISQLTPRFEIE